VDEGLLRYPLELPGVLSHRPAVKSAI